MHVIPHWKSLFPFESREIELDGHRYHYVDEGAGDVLLLVHGNPTWSFYWRKLIAGLSPRYRVIAIDHMGCGLSDKPAGYPYYLAQHIDNLDRFIERLQLKDITLLAHDWGGPIGIGAALADKKRFRRYILFNTAAFHAEHIPRRIAMCRWPMFGRVAVQGLNLFARAALKMAVSHRERMTPDVRAGMLAPYDSWNNREAIYRFVEDIPASAQHPSYTRLKDIELGLPQLAARPWMFVWGMQDWCFTPAFLEKFLHFFPKAEVHRLEDAGHYVIEDAYERIVPIVQSFLAAHPLSRDGVVSV